MDFSLTDDQRAIEAAARIFADAELVPNSARWDEEEHFPRDILQKAAALGFAGLYVGEDLGGSSRGWTPRSPLSSWPMATSPRPPSCPSTTWRHG
jgi:alkylation response protein AidB-like acyl-CoA dehydrogenase